MDHDVLDAVVAGFDADAGVGAKRGLRLIEQAFGASDWLHGPGDDAAVVTVGGQSALAAGELIYPAFVKADPFGAGVAAVVANVNDIAAMGGRPLALVDTVLGTRPVAERILAGIRHAAAVYGVTVVGGHLTLAEGEPALSAFILGAAGERVLSVNHVRPGHAVLAAYCLEGVLRDDFPFLASLPARAPQLAADVAVLARLAAEGLCLAARDISMGGLLGSLAMLLEPTAAGLSVDLARVPRPAGVALPRWLRVFPTYGFVLSVPPEEVAACRTAFTERGLACERLGDVDASGQLRIGLSGRERLLLDVGHAGFTRAGRASPAGGQAIH